MVGLIVIAAIGGVIAATVFAVIPWAQTHAAQGDLRAIDTAESVAYVQTGSYLTVDELVEAGYLEPPDGHVSAASSEARVTPAADITQTPSVFVIVGDNGNCYIAGAKAATGSIFYATSDTPSPLRFVVDESETDSCTPAGPLVAALGGVTDGGVQVPATPTSVTAVSGDRAATVQWEAASSTAASYTVTPYLGDAAQPSTTVTGSTLPLSAKITGLVNGSAYTFRVSAANSSGTSVLSAPSISVTPQGLVVNGGFEEGMTGWYFSLGFLNAGTPRTGATSERLGQTGNTARMYQYVTVPNTGKTTYSFWYRMESSTSTFSNVSASVIPTSGATKYIGIRNSQTAGTPFWSEGVADLTAYAGQEVRLDFYLDNRNSGSYAGLTVDDVTLSNE
jgi:hypothetical protein